MALKEKILDRAQKFIQKGYLDKAVAEYRAAFDLDPKDTTIRLRIGELYIKMGMKAEAIKEYADAARANSQRGFNLKAIAVYKQALKLDETNLDIHNRLAELYAKQRLLADAISEYGYIVSSFEKKGRTNEALEIIKKMVEVDPENTGVRLKLAEYYQRLGFEKDSIAEYAGVFNKLVSQGKADRAEKIFTGLYNTYPNDPEILSGLAALNKAKGDTQQFLRFSGKLAGIYAAKKDNDKAKEVYERILEVRPNDPDGVGFMKQYDAARAREAKTEIKTAPQEVAVARHEEAPLVPEAPALKAPAEEAPLIDIEFAQEAPSAPVQAGPAAEPSTEEPPLIEFEFPEAEAREQAAKEPQEEIEIELAGFEEAAGEAKPAAGAPVEAPALEPLVDLEPEAGAAREMPEAGRPPESPEPVAQAGEKAVEEEALISVEIPPVEEVVPAQENIEIEAEAPLEVIEPQAPEAAQPPAQAGVPEEAPAEEAFEPRGEAPAEVFLEPIVEAPAEQTQEVPVQEVSERFAEQTAPAQAVEPVHEEAAQAIVEQEAAAPVTAQAKPRTPEEEERVDEAISEAITELLEKYEPREPVAAVPEKEIKVEQGAEEKGAGKEEYIDLSAELGIEDEVESLAGTLLLGESKETLDEFKTGLEKQLGKEDSETHYNLGIAYMEMGLLREASNEFKIALKDPGLEFDCYTRLGLCANSEKNPDDAILFFLKALRVEGRSSDERMGVMYELALSYKAANNREEARELFKSVYKANAEYRDVAREISLLEGTAGAAPSIPYDDNLIEVELL